MSDNLSPRKRAILLTLLLHGPTLSNSKYENFRLDVDPVDREQLNAQGLVVSVRKVAYVHTLTDAGRKWCLDDLAAGAPRKGDSALERALYAVLGVVRDKVDIGELFGAAPEQMAEAAVRRAYTELRREPGAWVSLADLRERLKSVPKSNLDAALKRLNRKRGVVLVPESDQTSLTDRERGAALTLGGQHQHLIKIEGA